jgi:hypothetical protein
MCRNWQADGINLWTITEAILTLTEDTASYLLGGDATNAVNVDDGSPVPRPLQIISARRRDSSGQDVPLTAYLRDQYFNQPNKSASGVTTAYYYDPQRGQGVLYLWPINSDTTETVRFTYQRPLEDFDSVGDNPDFPVEWHKALVYGLAYELCDEYGIPDNIMARIERKHKETYRKLKARDVGEGLFLQPTYWERNR